MNPILRKQLEKASLDTITRVMEDARSRMEGADGDYLAQQSEIAEYCSRLIDIESTVLDGPSEVLDTMGIPIKEVK